MALQSEIRILRIEMARHMEAVTSSVSYLSSDSAEAVINYSGVTERDPDPANRNGQAYGGGYEISELSMF
jgi:hypothetical protein